MHLSFSSTSGIAFFYELQHGILHSDRLQKKRAGCVITQSALKNFLFSGAAGFHKIILSAMLSFHAANEFFGVLGGHRTSPDKALNVVAADTSERVELLGILNALGDDIEPHDMPHGYHGFDVLL